MSKRAFIILLTAILLVASSHVVCADVVFGNDFLYKNESKTERLERQRFVINDPEGYVIVRDKPGSTVDATIEHLREQWPGVKDDIDYIKRAITFNNGELIQMSQTYILNGEYWGVVSSGHSVGYPGWILMDHLLAVYEREDFEKENEDKFYTYSGDCSALYTADRIVLWQWPGSDREKMITSHRNDFTVLRAYKDNEGREWGSIETESGYSGRTSYAWVCLTDPAAVGIHAFNPSALPAKWSPDDIKWEYSDEPTSVSNWYSLSNFVKSRKYEQGVTFDDVSENTLYLDSIIKAYEYGIVDNRYYRVEIDENSWRYVLGFGAEQLLTWEDIVIMTARTHSVYKYGVDEGRRFIELYTLPYAGGRMWMRGYNDYIISEGLDSEIFSLGYNRRPLTREQIITFFSKILQDKDMPSEKLDYLKALSALEPNGNMTYAEAVDVLVNILEIGN